MIHGLQLALGRAAELQWLPPQPGDVPQTWANIDKAQTLLRLLAHDHLPRWRAALCRLAVIRSPADTSMSTEHFTALGRGDMQQTAPAYSAD